MLRPTVATATTPPAPLLLEMGAVISLWDEAQGQQGTDTRHVMLGTSSTGAALVSPHGSASSGYFGSLGGLPRGVTWP